MNWICEIVEAGVSRVVSLGRLYSREAAWDKARQMARHGCVLQVWMD